MLQTHQTPENAAQNKTKYGFFAKSFLFNFHFHIQEDGTLEAIQKFPSKVADLE